jgi:hypothetical protein
MFPSNPLINNFISAQPEKTLIFKYVSGREGEKPKSKLILTNLTSKKKVFKVMHMVLMPILKMRTNKPDYYSVFPIQAVIEPKSRMKVTISLRI